MTPKVDFDASDKLLLKLAGNTARLHAEALEKRGFFETADLFRRAGAKAMLTIKGVVD